jgi:hypothetical protein
MSQDPWSLLETGDRFKIVSYSGKKYEATFLLAGKDDAGLYVRLQDKKLARFQPGRLIWTSLEKSSGGGDVLSPGDDVLIQTKDGLEMRGKLQTATAAKIAVKTANGDVVEVRADNAVEGSFRILFPASDLRAGDEFLVRSSSGREYRGRASTVEKDRVAATLLAGGEPVSIRVEHLDLRTLYVLVALPVFAGTAKPG